MSASSTVLVNPKEGTPFSLLWIFLDTEPFF